MTPWQRLAALPPATLRDRWARLDPRDTDALIRRLSIDQRHQLLDLLTRPNPRHDGAEKTPRPR